MKIKNGVLLAGGTGSRLQPFTSVISKHLIPIHGKFIIDYPIQTLKNCGVENLTIIVGSSFSGQIIDYLQDGKRYNMNFNYIYQNSPSGIAQAINLCRRFVMDGDRFVVILGDNIYDNDVVFSENQNGAQIILNKHPELYRFGVASIKNNKIINIEEKPKSIRSDVENYAITGCYLFDREFFDYFKQTKPSNRNEYEITDIINLYHKDNGLGYSLYNGLWQDAGTHESVNYLNHLFFKESNKK